MKGDFSRQTFDPARHYSSVRMQQGRVLVDADWNEQDDILAHRSRTATADIIGRCGGPAGNAGFRLVRGSGGLTDAERNPDGEAIPPAPPDDLLITRGRFYVDGRLVENERTILLSRQPDLPSLPDTPRFPAAGRYIAYLDVWERHITALDDPSIREVALGGPDTTTRSRMIWQVKFWRTENEEFANSGCGVSFEGFDSAIAPSSGRLRARTKPVADPADPCSIPPDAGFRGLENQLYRVEVHEPYGADGGAGRFKWSRDNGSVVTIIEKIESDAVTVTVHDLGPDTVLGFAPGQWVEICDDQRELNGLPGELVQIKSIDLGRRIITLKAPLTSSPDFTGTRKLRRWDGIGTITFGTDSQPNQGYIDLEDGVQVRFKAGTYHTGDYWTIPARTATSDEQSGNIEWPRVANVPLDQLPFGIRHHYCRIAMVVVNGEGNIESVDDCRCLFSALTDLSGFFYVGGDGQETRPTHRMPQPLQVAIFNVGMSGNCAPVARAKVRFSTLQGGHLAGRDAGDAALQAAGNSITVETEANGIASVVWLPRPDIWSQQVEARWLNEQEEPRPEVIYFNGQLSIAAEVAYTPKECDNLQGVTTVQDALDRICRKLNCHDFLDDLRSDGVVRNKEGELGLRVTGFSHATQKGGLPTVRYEPGVAYIHGCRRVIKEAGTVALEQSAVGQWVVVTRDGEVKILPATAAPPISPPPRDCALLAVVSTCGGMIERVVDLRRDLTHLDEQVERNRHGIATARKDAQQYVPWLAGTLPDLRHRDSSGVYGYRDGRNRLFDITPLSEGEMSIAGVVFDGEYIWGALNQWTPAPKHFLFRISRYATEITSKDLIDTGHHLQSGAFDGACVWFTAPYVPAGGGSGNVVVIDVKTFATKVIPVPGVPQAIMFDGRYIWITTHALTLIQIDVECRRIVRTFIMTESNEPGTSSVTIRRPLALEFDGEYIWVSGQGQTLFRIKKPFGNPERVNVKMPGRNPVPDSSDFRQLAFDGSHLWMQTWEGTVLKMDVLTHAHQEVVFEQGPSPYGGMIFDGTHLWIMANSDKMNPERVPSIMYKVDPRTAQVLGSIALPRTPIALGELAIRVQAFDGTHLWYPYQYSRGRTMLKSPVDVPSETILPSGTTSGTVVPLGTISGATLPSETALPSSIASASPRARATTVASTVASKEGQARAEQRISAEPKGSTGEPIHGFNVIYGVQKFLIT